MLIHDFDSDKGDSGDSSPASQFRLNYLIKQSSNRKEKKIIKQMKYNNSHDS
jgi:hypothetical protein